MGVTLREGDREYFYEKLDEHFPGMKERYIKQYGNSYEVTSPNNRKLMELFKGRCLSHGIISDLGQCFQYISEFEEKNPYEQLTLPGLLP